MRHKCIAHHMLLTLHRLTHRLTVGAFSGLLAYGISFLSGTAGLLGWSWIFVRDVTFQLVYVANVVLDCRGAGDSGCRAIFVFQ